MKNLTFFLFITIFGLFTMIPNPADAFNAMYIEKIRSDERRAEDAKAREGEMPFKKACLDRRGSLSKSKSCDDGGFYISCFHKAGDNSSHFVPFDTAEEIGCPPQYGTALTGNEMQNRQQGTHRQNQIYRIFDDMIQILP